MPEIHPQPAPDVARQPEGVKHPILTLVGAAAAGSVLITGAVNVDRHVRGDGPIEFNSDGTYNLKQTAKISPGTHQGKLGRVDSDFRKALAVDNCETKVTPEEALDMYQQLFGVNSAPSRNLGTLQTQSRNALERLQQSRDKLTFAEFPVADYEKLWLDSYSLKPQLPVAEYQRVLDGYLSQLGIETVYTWDQEAEDSPNTDFIQPVDNAAQQTQEMQRRTILSAIGGSVDLSKELKDQADIRRVVFGDLTDASALGQVVFGEHDILVDTSMVRDGDTKALTDNDYVIKTIIPHEGTHFLHYNLCGAVLSKLVGDNSMRSLNGGIIYAQDVTEGEVSQQFSTLLPKDQTEQSTEPAKVVAVRDYGIKSPLEDVATQGEVAFYGPNTKMVYQVNTIREQDMTIEHEKLALLLARVKLKNPLLAEYYIRQLQVARLQVGANASINATWTKMDRVLINHPEMTEDKSDPAYRRYRKLDKQINAYFRIRSKLDSELQLVEEY